MQKSLIFGLLLVGAAYATSPSTQYLPPSTGSFAAASVQQPSVASPSNEYLPPAASNNHASLAPAPVPQASVSHSSFAPPSQQYLAPVSHQAAASVPQASYAAATVPQASFAAAASEPAPAHSLSNDGYRYKTVRRRYRHRRAAPGYDYLPPQASEKEETIIPAPSQQSNTVIAPPGVSAEANLENHVITKMEDSYAAAPSGNSIQTAEPESAHSLESDGYHYKTVKRYRLRRRY